MNNTQNEFIFKNILSNRFSYIPLWKLAIGDNIIFKKYNDGSWKLYNKNTSKIHKIYELKKMNSIQKTIFFGAEFFVVFVSILAFIYNSLKIFIPLQFLIFIGITIIAYIIAFKFKKDKLFNLFMTTALVLSSGWVLYIFSSKELFYTMTFYAALYVAFTFSIPSIIEKRKILRGENEVMVFASERKGNILICYNSDLYTEEEIDIIEENRKEKEHNILSKYNSLLKRKERLEDELLLKQHDTKVKKKDLEKINKTLNILNNEIDNIEKEVKKFKNNKELMNEF